MTCWGTTISHNQFWGKGRQDKRHTVLHCSGREASIPQIHSCLSLFFALDRFYGSHSSHELHFRQSPKTFIAPREYSTVKVPEKQPDSSIPAVDFFFFSSPLSVLKYHFIGIVVLKKGSGQVKYNDHTGQHNFSCTSEVLTSCLAAWW